MTNHRTEFLAAAKRVADALGDSIPAFTPQIREEAEHAAVGEIVMDAEKRLFHKVGLSHIDWRCTAASNRESAEMALLRFHFIAPLASAYRATGDERYAETAKTYIGEFIRDHPTVPDWKPADHDGATQYDLRIGCAENCGWLGSLPVFMKSAAFDDAFFEMIIASAQAHLRYLSGHVWPDRNIRSLHGDVLLTNGLRLPFLPEAAAWRDQGVRILNDAFHRQILPDGAHVEAAPHYHCVVMNLFHAMWRLAQAMPEVGLAITTDMISRMYDYALACTLPDGTITPMHDSRGGQQEGARRNPVLEQRAAFRSAAGLSAELPPPSRMFADAGQVYLRDRWGEAGTYITFDATTRRSYHWHPGRNSIQLYAHGRALLVDSGYPFAKADFPAYGYRTRDHSTLNLNGWDQCQAQAQLRYRSVPGYDLVEGLYEGGYWPVRNHAYGEGIYAEHHRTLLWIRDRCIVVLDHLSTTSEAGRKPTLESIWQLGPGPVKLDPVQRTAVTQHPDSNLLMLFPLQAAGMQMSVHEGERDPYRGWLALDWGERYTAAPQIRLAVEKYDPWNADLATVLVPFAGNAEPRVTVEATGPSIESNARTVGKLVLRWADGSADELFWTRRLETVIGEQAGFDSDAALVHLQRDAGGTLTRGLVVDGSYLRPFLSERKARLEMFRV